MSEEQSAQERPLLRVVRGNPTPEELAALVAVVSTRGTGGGDPEPAAAPSLWSRPQLRAPLSAGAGAWRASGLPH